ncbi:Methyltransferase-like protein 13 [Smittium culicis]|uniref:Methyltransferase-like protein 13 n=1 Tax=Smittium culicis TaxID=133412 RepID=A0A1R1YTD0_9FUNG|nr:Methyltransferase-like protein 13 [Smittium culicis]
MAVLNVNAVSYDSKDYWVSRFEREESFEWLLDYVKLKPVLEKHCCKSNSILNLGCGNSLIPLHLYDEGYYGHSLNLDYCENVIQNMRDFAETRYSPEQMSQECFPKWAVADVTDMKQVKNCSFDVVFDKSTADCLACLDNDGSALRLYESEIYRVCKDNGCWISISYSKHRWENLDFRNKWLLTVDSVECSDDNVLQSDTSFNIARPKQYQYIFIFKKIPQTL